MRKRILSLVLSLCMVVAMLPMGAITASAEVSDSVSDTGSFTENDSMTLLGTDNLITDVSLQSVTEYVYSVNSEADLRTAIANAPTDGSATTIQLGANITVTNLLDIIDKNIILDLNGKELSRPTSFLRLENNTQLEVKDTSTGANGKLFVTNSGSSAILNDGTGIVTISSGTVSTGYGSAILGGDVIISGGTVTSTNGGHTIQGRNVEISGGTITATKGTAGTAGIAVTSYGNLTISGGTISSELLSVHNLNGTGTKISGGTLDTVYVKKLDLSGDPTLTVNLSFLTDNKFTITGELTGEEGDIELDGTSFTPTGTHIVATADNEAHADVSKFSLINLEGKTLIKDGANLVLSDSSAPVRTFNINEGNIKVENGTTAGKIKVTYGTGQIEDNIDPRDMLTISGESTTNVISVNTSEDRPVNITLNNVNIDVESLADISAFDIQNNSVVNLTLTGNNKLYSGQNRAGLQVQTKDEKTATVTIDGLGELDARAGYVDNNLFNQGGAGIGGSNGSDGGTITINGGTVMATASNYAGAGIGGGYNGAGGTITINDGTVTAIGGVQGAAGIGGGLFGAAGTITIRGGSVTATSYEGWSFAGGPGLGHGASSTAAGGSITISGGTVTAAGGRTSAGIQVKGSLKIDDTATVIAVSTAVVPSMSHINAIIDADGIIEASAVDKTVANVLMVKYAAEVTANTATTVKNGASEIATLAPASSYKSIAFTVPTGNYTLFKGTAQQTHSEPSSATFEVSALGLNSFSNVKDDSSTPPATTIAKNITIGTAAPVRDAAIVDGNNTPPTGATGPVVTWSADNGATYAAASGNFAADTAYKTKYVYTANVGYAFDSAISENDITVTNLGGGTKTVALTDDNKTLTITVTWPATGIADSSAQFPDNSHYAAMVDQDNVITGYDTFAEAWSAIEAEKPATIKLYQDVTSSSNSPAAWPMEISTEFYNTIIKHITIDLNGHTINRGLTVPTTKGNIFTVGAGSLTIQDSSSTVVEEQGSITGGYATDFGGAIYVVDPQGRLTMTGGNITGNKSDFSGAAISIAAGDFTMSGGRIYNNEAAHSAGGVHVNALDTSSFTMTGGSITGNKAGSSGSWEAGHAAGVFAASGFKVGGPVNITDNINIKSNTQSNVSLPSFSTPTSIIEVTGSLDGARIGVSRGWEGNGTGIVTTGYNTYNSSLDPTTIFISDNSTMIVQKSGNGEAELVVNPNPFYSLTVNLNGGNGGTTGGSYASGVQVAINAGTKAGHTFSGWTTSNGGTFANASQPSTTFTMPQGATTIRATWTIITTCNATLTPPTFAIADQTIAANQPSRTITMNASGSEIIGDCLTGTISYTYNITSGGNAAGAVINGNQLTIAPTSPGTYNITVEATASLGEKTSTRTITFTVTKVAPPATETTCIIENLTFTVPTLTIPAGQDSTTHTLTASATLAQCPESHTGDIVYIYSTKNNNAGASIDGNQLTVTRKGTVTILVTASHEGATATKEVTINVINTDVDEVEKTIDKLPSKEDFDNKTEEEKDDLANDNEDDINNANEDFNDLNDDKKGQVDIEKRQHLDDLVDRLGNIKARLNRDKAKATDINAWGLTTAIDVRADIQAGRNVTIQMDIEDENNSSTPEATKADGDIIRMVAKSQQKETSVAFSINLIKIIEEAIGDETKVTTQVITETQAPVYITITIPENMRGGSEYEIMHIHTNAQGGKEVQIIVPVYDESKHTLTFSMSRFSTIAITYKAKTADSGDQPSGGGGGGATPTLPPKTEQKPEVEVPETDNDILIITPGTEGDQEITHIELDKEKTKDIFDKDSTKKDITINIDTNKEDGQQGAQITIPADIIDIVEERGGYVRVITDEIEWEMSASQLKDIIQQSQRQQAGVTQDINVTVTAKVTDQQRANRIIQAATKPGTQVVSQLFDFNVATAYNQRSYESNSLFGYATLRILVPLGLEKYTTAVRFDDNGNMYHTPTNFKWIDGRLYAEINSFTSGTYGMVYTPRTFSDVIGHWSEKAVTNMASRLIVAGVGDNRFEPDRNITRAEFVTLLIKSLGLAGTLDVNTAEFSDVTSDKWYYEAVQIARAQGFISGYGNNEFKPQETINRQEAMIMLAKAAGFAGLAGNSQGTAILNNYIDESEVAPWAKDHVALVVGLEIFSGFGNDQLQPKASMSRSQSAQAINNQLTISQLINP